MLKSFKSPGGRTFTVGAVEREKPRYKNDPHWSEMWPILYQGKRAGSLWRSASYGPERPWTATIRQLASFDLPTGIGFDVAAFSTSREALIAWGRSADDILDYRAGKNVPSVYSKSGSYKKPKPSDTLSKLCERIKKRSVSR